MHGRTGFDRSYVLVCLISCQFGVYIRFPPEACIFVVFVVKCGGYEGANAVALRLNRLVVPMDEFHAGQDRSILQKLIKRSFHSGKCVFRHGRVGALL